MVAQGAAQNLSYGPSPRNSWANCRVFLARAGIEGDDAWRAIRSALAHVPRVLARVNATLEGEKRALASVALGDALDAGVRRANGSNAVACSGSAPTTTRSAVLDDTRSDGAGRSSGSIGGLRAASKGPRPRSGSVPQLGDLLRLRFVGYNFPVDAVVVDVDVDARCFTARCFADGSRDISEFDPNLKTTTSTTG